MSALLGVPVVHMKHTSAQGIPAAQTCNMHRFWFSPAKQTSSKQQDRLPGLQGQAAMCCIALSKDHSLLQPSWHPVLLLAAGLFTTGKTKKVLLFLQHCELNLGFQAH